MIPLLPPSTTRYPALQSEQSAPQRKEKFEKLSNTLVMETTQFLTPWENVNASNVSSRFYRLCNQTLMSKNYSCTMPNYLISIGIKNPKLISLIRDRDISMKKFAEHITKNRKELAMAMQRPDLSSSATKALTTPQVRNLVIEGELSLYKAIRLDATQLAAITSTGIQKYYGLRLIEVSLILKLDITALRNIDDPAIQQLIDSHFIKIESALELTDHERNILVHPTVQDKIFHGELSINEALDLDPETLDIWRNEWEEIEAEGLYQADKDLAQSRQDSGMDRN